jgi:hypothetical protein
MTDLPRAQFVRAQDQYGAYRPEDYAGYGDGGPSSRGAGWIAFAAVLMALAGGLYVIAGFVTLFESRYYEVNTSVLTVDQSWTVLGWTQLILGVLVLAAGFALARGYVWARIVAIVLAGVAIVENFLNIAAAPVWHLLLIGLAIMIVYACIVQGQDDLA